MKSPSVKALEVWSGESLIYSRPNATPESQIMRAG
jgi:hypothetical protein